MMRSRSSVRRPAPNEALSLRRNMVWNSAGSFVNYFCQWLITVIVVRLSSSYDAAGVYTYVMAVYALFAPVANYRTYVYQVSDLHGENTLGEYFSFRCLTSGMALAITMLYALVSCDPSMLLSIFLFTLYKLVLLVSDVFHACEQKHERMDYIGISYGLQGILSLTVFSVVFGLTKDMNMTFAAMMLTGLVFGLVYDLPKGRLFEEFVPRLSWKKAWDLLKTCAPAVLGSVAGAGAVSIPRQYLSFALGEAALGAYGTMAAPVAVIQTGASYIYNPLITYFIRSFEAGDHVGFKRLMAKVVVALVALGLVCAVGVQVLGDPFFTAVYGESARSHLYLLQPLVLSAILVAFQAFMNDLVMALRSIATTFWSNVISVSIAMVAMVPAVTSFGPNGVTITLIAATVGSLLYMTFGLRAVLRSMPDVDPVKGTDHGSVG